MRNEEEYTTMNCDRRDNSFQLESIIQWTEKKKKTRRKEKKSKEKKTNEATQPYDDDERIKDEEKNFIRIYSSRFRVGG